MDLIVRAVPKPVSKPKVKPKKPKKKKNPNLYRGRMVPTKKDRTRITADAYSRMKKEFGEYCLNCGHMPVEAHHIVFRSQMGTGGWRNLAPLCHRCHVFTHKHKALADMLRVEREALYGKWYFADKYTLFKENLIPNTTDEAYERFMKGEEAKCREESPRTGEER
jgi:nitrate/TMAO reductase-like tetraheme cytochrome c subunit